MLSQLFLSDKLLEEVRNIEIDGVAYCRLVSHFDDFADFGFVSDENLEGELRRAFNLLTPETVDFGVFQLGRILENVIREYLKLGRDLEALEVKDGQLANLGTMTDCLAMNGILRDKAILAFLRETRNDPAHNLTTQEERQKLMEEAVLPVKFYMQVIEMIHLRTLELRRSEATARDD